MQRIGLALLAALALVGCASAPAPPSPQPSPSAVTEVPEDGALLTSLGFTHAPAAFSVPRRSVISDRIDAYNNVTAVFTVPPGQEIAEYLRTNLPAMGFELTADRNQSLLFTDGHWQGAFTTSGSYAALSLRTDREDS